MDYLVYAYLQRGRQADADQVVKALGTMDGLRGPDFKVGYAATAMPVRLDMEGHDWDAAVRREPLPESAHTSRRSSLARAWLTPRGSPASCR